MSITLTLADWLSLLTHFLSLSLLAIGGAVSTLPDMHRILVDDNHWLLDNQFSGSVALAQAAPGPNVLFVALMGWNVGLNAGGGLAAGPHAWALGMLGLTITMVGIMLPSTTLTYMATRWGHRNRNRRGVRAFKQGMAPIVVGLLVATGVILANGNQRPDTPAWHLWLVAGVAGLVVWRTKTHLLWLLGAGAALGALGFV